MRFSLRAFLTTLVLVAALGMAGSAQALALSAPAGFTPVAVPTFLLDEEGDEAEDEGQVEGETAEDDGLEAEECDAGGAAECDEELAGDAPEECLLSSAEPTVLATAGRRRLRLRIAYTTSAPTTVVVDYGLHGKKGSLHLGTERERLASEGVLRLTRKLSEAQMARVTAASDFTVRLRVALAPTYCQVYFEHRLNLRRATRGGLVWSQAR